MINARHQPLYVAFFEMYSGWMMKRHFREIKIVNRTVVKNTPVMMIGNHFSWWDGFFTCYINRHIFHKRLHIMMLEDELRKRMFLNKAGAYGIRKKSRDAIRSLDYTATLMKDKQNMVVLYPQGEFESVYRYPVTFRKGIEVAARQLTEDYQLVFYAALIDYFSFRKPTLTLYLEDTHQSVAQSADKLEKAYNDFLKECYSKQRPE